MGERHRFVLFVYACCGVTTEDFREQCRSSTPAYMKTSRPARLEVEAANTIKHESKATRYDD